MLKKNIVFQCGLGGMVRKAIDEVIGAFYIVLEVIARFFKLSWSLLFVMVCYFQRILQGGCWNCWITIVPDNNSPVIGFSANCGLLTILTLLLQCTGFVTQSLGSLLPVLYLIWSFFLYIYNNKASISVKYIFAQWIQNIHTLAPSATTTKTRKIWILWKE